MNKQRKSKNTDDLKLIDSLERYIKKQPLLLWNGVGLFPSSGFDGLSLLAGKQSLRSALQHLHDSERER